MQYSLVELEELAVRICRHCVPGDVICLQGPLGSGKTTFAKKLCQQLGIDADQVSSPTYVLHHLYQVITSPIQAVNHFDLYRLRSPLELESINFEELVWGDDLTLVEWPQVAHHILPPDRLEIEFDYGDQSDRRTIELNPLGNWRERLAIS